MDYSSVLSGVIQAVTRAGELLVAEWQRPEGPRGAGDKADVDLEIEALLRPCLLDLCINPSRDPGCRQPCLAGSRHFG